MKILVLAFAAVAAILAAGCGGTSKSNCGTIGNAEVRVRNGGVIFQGAGECARDPGESTSMTFAFRESTQPLLSLTVMGNVQPGTHTCGDDIAVQLDGLEDYAAYYEVPQAGLNGLHQASCTFVRGGRDGTFTGVLQRTRRADDAVELIDVSFGFLLPPAP